MIQWTSFDFEAELARFSDGDGESFIAELWVEELPSLTGREHFRDGITRVLCRRGLDVALADEVLSVWSHIAVDEDALDVIRSVRAAGVACHLATNQQSFRRGIMAGLGYDDVFDRQFYSCELGYAKPDPAYFTAILDELGVGPQGVVFVDDRADNVAAAASVGIDAHVHTFATGADGLRELLRGAGVPGA